VRGFKVRGPMTAAEHIFAVAMTVVIVWIVAEVGPNTLKR
jgi:hypothetical protein